MSSPAATICSKSPACASTSRARDSCGSTARSASSTGGASGSIAAGFAPSATSSCIAGCSSRATSTAGFSLLRFDRSVPGTLPLLHRRLQAAAERPVAAAVFLEPRRLRSRSDRRTRLHGPHRQRRTTYQFTRAFSLRGIAQFDSSRFRVLGDFLSSYEPRPGTVVYAGYGSLLEQREFIDGQWAPAREPIRRAAAGCSSRRPICIASEQPTPS